VVVARGSGGGTSLLLNGHIDTVGVSGMADPFGARIEGGKLYGRGAYDMKGGVAASLWAAARAKERGLRGDVIVTCVADEEVASLGTQAVLETWRADAAIVTEPTALDLCVAHKGFVWWEVEVQGRAAHGSRPDLGIDAIAKAGSILSDIQALDLRLRASAGHPLLGSGSVHVSLIRGGQEMSSYPESCAIGIEHGRIFDVPFERHLPVVHGGTTGDFTDREWNLLANQRQRLPDALPRDASADRIKSGSELMQPSARHDGLRIHPGPRPEPIATTQTSL
jgi:acetylornithine deacetylase/succinyl-diaminopimelate desuccinylase-like protein